MRPGRKTEERKEEFPQIVGQSRQNDYKEIWAQGAALANSTVNRIFCRRNLAILYKENFRIIQSHDGGGQGGGESQTELMRPGDIHGQRNRRLVPNRGKEHIGPKNVVQKFQRGAEWQKVEWTQTGWNGSRIGVGRVNGQYLKQALSEAWQHTVCR